MPNQQGHAGVPTRQVYRGQNDNFLSDEEIYEMRERKMTAIIIFRLPEEVGDRADMQFYIDREHVNNILGEIGLSHLQNRVRYTARLGNGTTVRPLKVVFTNNDDREEVVRNAWKLKSSINYRSRASITRDMMREDRVRQKARYEYKRRQNNIDWDTVLFTGILPGEVRRGDDGQDDFHDAQSNPPHRDDNSEQQHSEHEDDDQSDISSLADPREVVEPAAT